MIQYDYLIVGAGFYGSTFARLVTDVGKKCLIIDKRNHIGGNAYDENIDGINVHKYGPHIFHTNDDDIWDFVNRFSRFNNFVLTPKALTNGRIYSLPFNMHTFNELWNCINPKQAKEIIDSQRFRGTPTNLEEQALSLVGTDIYELLIRGYTEKQWNKSCKNLPAFIIKRLPLRFTYNNNYFDDRYQGIPIDGYSKLFDNLLKGIHKICNVDYFDDVDNWNSQAKRIVYTGQIDQFFNYEFGDLQYRSLEFKTEMLFDTDNYQGIAQMNFPDFTVPYTRIIEHKHFNNAKTNFTIITKEYSKNYHRGCVPYYPINDDTNTEIYKKYREKANSLKNVIFGGRLGRYQYYNMDQVIGMAMKAVKEELI